MFLRAARERAKDGIDVVGAAKVRVRKAKRRVETGRNVRGESILHRTARKVEARKGR